MSIIHWQPLPRRRTPKGCALTIAGAAWCAGVFASVANSALHLAVDLVIIGVCWAVLGAFFCRLRSWRA